MGRTPGPPKWIKPQLTRLVDEAPSGDDWLHEIKYDGYRMHARLDHGKAVLLTRTGLDWSARYRHTIEALHRLPVKTAYLDGELCALRPDGVPAFSRLQAAMDEGRTDDLVFIVFDLLYLNGKSMAQLPLIERKERLQALFAREVRGLRFSDHVVGDGPRFREQACKMKLEGTISKRIDRAYAPGDRGLWVKTKCLNREEFIVVGWTKPAGSRQHFGALLLGYYTKDGRLHYAGRAGTGFTELELKRLAGVLRPLEVQRMPLDQPPPRETRFSLPGRPALEAFLREHVMEIIENRARYQAVGIGFPTAIVLHGPPGCGKTFAVERLVEHLGWPTFNIDAASVASPYIHETSRKIAKVFEEAAKSAPSVLVIDEMDAFLAERDLVSGHHGVEEVAEFLRRIPDAASNEILIVAMTNRLDIIDPAILRRGRFDHIIEVGPANESEVEALLETLLEKLPTKGDVNPLALAKFLIGRPLSDVAFVVREGARLAAQGGQDRIGQANLVAALEAAPARNKEPERRIGFV